jgi:hypothetical protein
VSNLVAQSFLTNQSVAAPENYSGAAKHSKGSPVWRTHVASLILGNIVSVNRSLGTAVIDSKAANEPGQKTIAGLSEKQMDQMAVGDGYCALGRYVGGTDHFETESVVELTEPVPSLGSVQMAAIGYLENLYPDRAVLKATDSNARYNLYGVHGDAHRNLQELDQRTRNKLAVAVGQGSGAEMVPSHVLQGRFIIQG